MTTESPQISEKTWGGWCKPHSLAGPSSPEQPVAALSSCSSSIIAPWLLCFAHGAQNAGPHPDEIWVLGLNCTWELYFLQLFICKLSILGRGVPVFPENPHPYWERDPRQAAHTTVWMCGSGFSWAQDVTFPWISATYNIYCDAGIDFETFLKLKFEYIKQ